MLHDGCWQRRLSKLVCAGAVAIFLAALTTEKAVADDEVDTFVNAIALAGAIGNVPINEGDKVVIKFIIRCAANSTTIVICAHQQIINQLQLQLQLQLPPELTECILDGTPLERCASKDLLNASGLPVPVQQLLACISDTGDVGNCANQAVTAEGHQILDVIEKLKADARSDAMTELDAATSGTMRNILSLFKAVQANDWVGVTIYGGPEIYKQVAHAVLDAIAPEIFTTLGPVLNPVIDDIIQARADLLAKLTTGVRNGDAHLVGEAITEAYLTEGILVPCALLPNDIRDTLCGPIGKIIHSIADASGDVTDFFVSLIKDPLGIPGSVWDELVKLEQTVFLNKQHDCLPPERYYANNYVRCYHRGVRQLSSSTAQLDQLVSSLNHRCQSHYDRCFTSDHFDSLCNPQKEMFSNHVRQLVSSVNSAASSYTRLFPQFVREQGPAAACDRQSFMVQAFQEFLDRCAGQVAVEVPLLGDPDSDDCDTHPSTISVSHVAHRAACERAMAQVDTDAILRDVCAPIVDSTADASLLGETVSPVIIEPIQPHLP